MKRTAGNIIHSALFEREKITDHFLNAGGVKNACYGWFADHLKRVANLKNPILILTQVMH